MENEKEVIEAVVVETDLAATDFALDLTAIQQDVTDLEASVASAHRTAATMDATPEAIKAMDYAMAKNYEQGINKAIQDAEARRKKLKADYTLPINDAEAKFKAVMAPVYELHAAYKERRIEAEEQEKAAKKVALAEYYAELAPMLVELVPFSRIFDPKWLNRSMSMGKCQQAIEDAVEKVAELEQTFNGLVEKGAVAHEVECKAVLFSQLSLEAAMERDRALTAAEERVRALDEQREERRRRMYETTVTAAEAAGIDAEQTHRYEVEVNPAVLEMTHETAKALAATLKKFGLSGRIRRVEVECND